MHLLEYLLILPSVTQLITGKKATSFSACQHQAIIMPNANVKVLPNVLTYYRPDDGLVLTSRNM
jgi:hypothetical protein